MPISPLDNVLANILGGEHSRPDQKAVSCFALISIIT